MLFSITLLVTPPAAADIASFSMFSR